MSRADDQLVPTWYVFGFDLTSKTTLFVVSGECEARQIYAGRDHSLVVIRIDTNGVTFEVESELT